MHWIKNKPSTMHLNSNIKVCTVAYFNFQLRWQLVVGIGTQGQRILFQEFSEILVGKSVSTGISIITMTCFVSGSYPLGQKRYIIAGFKNDSVLPGKNLCSKDVYLVCFNSLIFF